MEKIGVLSEADMDKKRKNKETNRRKIKEQRKNRVKEARLNVQVKSNKSLDKETYLK